MELLKKNLKVFLYLSLVDNLKIYFKVFRLSLDGRKILKMSTLFYLLPTLKEIEKYYTVVKKPA